MEIKSNKDIMDTSIRDYRQLSILDQLPHIQLISDGTIATPHNQITLSASSFPSGKQPLVVLQYYLTWVLSRQGWKATHLVDKAKRWIIPMLPLTPATIHADTFQQSHDSSLHTEAQWIALHEAPRAKIKVERKLTWAPFRLVFRHLALKRSRWFIIYSSGSSQNNQLWHSNLSRGIMIDYVQKHLWIPGHW